MPSELRPLVAPLGLRRSREGGLALHRGSLAGTEVVAALAGVGLRAAAARAERLIDAVAPERLVVVGIAGGIGPSMAVGDLVVPEQVERLATGRRFRPAPFGEHPPRGVLASSDALLESPVDAARLGERGIVAIDMETAAVAEACERRGCPWSVFRAVSDRADDGSTDAAVLGLIDAEGRPIPAAVARFLVRRPQRIPQLVRLARGSRAATRAAAGAAIAAIARDGRRP